MQFKFAPFTRTILLDVLSVFLVAASVFGQPDDDDLPAPPSGISSPFGDLSAFSLPRTSAASSNLASLPNMLGDFYRNRGTLCAVIEVEEIIEDEIETIVTTTGTVVRDFGGYRTKISENNKPIPQHRVYFQFNHFHNALGSSEEARIVEMEDFSSEAEYEIFGDERRFRSSLNRYTLGMERTFFDGLCSLEVRIPLQGSQTFIGPDILHPPGPDFAVENGAFGDLSFVTKRLIRQTDSWAVGGGLGISVPTGPDAEGFIKMAGEEAFFRMKNRAVYLTPFVGVVCSPHPMFFYEGFLEVNIPTTGNPVFVETASLGSVETGILNEPAWLSVDIAGGMWLYTGAPDAFITAVASLAELHYTTTLADADEFALDHSGNDFKFSAGDRRTDVLNLTVGFHIEIRQNTTVRVAGGFPLRLGDDAPFSSEINVSVNRFF